MPRECKRGVRLGGRHGLGEVLRYGKPLEAHPSAQREGEGREGGVTHPPVPEGWGCRERNVPEDRGGLSTGRESEPNPCKHPAE